MHYFYGLLLWLLEKSETIPNGTCSLSTRVLLDRDVIRTRNLLIWSQTRYRCATQSCSNHHLWLPVRCLRHYRKNGNTIPQNEQVLANKY